MPKAVLAFLIDIAGYIVFGPFIFMKAILSGNTSHPSSILLLRPDHMGDVLMATPAIVALKKRFSDARITVVVKEANRGLISLPGIADSVIGVDLPWVVGHKGIGRQWPYLLKKIKELRKEKFDLAIDLKGDLRNIILIFLLGAKERVSYAVRGGRFLLTREVKFQPGIRHEVERNLDIIKATNLLGGDADEKQLCYEAMPAKEIEIEKTLEKLFPQGKKLIGIHPGANSRSKLWPPAYFAGLVDRIEKEALGHAIIFAGPLDGGIIQELKASLKSRPVILDNLSFEDMASFFKKLDIFIGNDSGPFHLAEAVGTRVITVFGATFPEIVGPISRNSEVIRSRRRCVPCRRPGEKENCRTFKCLADISVEQVYDRVRKNLMS